MRSHHTYASLALVLVSSLLQFVPIKGTNITITEATIEDIQLAFTQDKLTSRHLVDFYLQQIHTLNPTLRSVLEVNPDARDQADKADRERQEYRRHERPLGALHGIPVLLKDSIATKDKLNTTAGSFALLGSKAPRDAHVVQKLREAGAVILGKASLSEWYGVRAFNTPNGWCARGGQAVVSSFLF